MVAAIIIVAQDNYGSEASFIWLCNNNIERSLPSLSHPSKSGTTIHYSLEEAGLCLPDARRQGKGHIRRDRLTQKLTWTYDLAPYIPGQYFDPAFVLIDTYVTTQREPTWVVDLATTIYHARDSASNILYTGT